MIAMFGESFTSGDIVVYSSQTSGLRFAVVLEILEKNFVRVLPNDIIDTLKPNRVSVKVSASRLLKLRQDQIPNKLLEALSEAHKHSKYRKGPKYSPKLRKNRKDWAVKFKIPKHGIMYRPLIKVDKLGNPFYDLLPPHKQLANACYVANDMVNNVEMSSFFILGVYKDQICRIYDESGELIDYDWYTLSKARKVYKNLLKKADQRNLEQYDGDELRKQAENATYLDDISSYYNVKPSEMKEILKSFDIKTKTRLDLS